MRPWSTATTVRVLSAYVCHGVLIKGQSPDTFSKSYLSHLANYIDLRGLNSNFPAARHHRRLQLTFRGLRRVFHHVHPQSQSRRLAVTLPMIDHMDAALGPVQSPTDRVVRMVDDLALRLGIYFLMRKSEFLPTAKSRGAQWRHLVFYDQHGNVIPRRHLQPGAAHSVVNRIPFSKTDPYGRGRILQHYRQPATSPCIVSKLEAWAIDARDQLGAINDRYLFEINSTCLVSTTRLVSTLRAIADHLGIRSGAISLHSLRYGGATMLAVAGLPQYVIEHFGGWSPNSKSPNTYIQLGGQSVATVSRAMSQMSQSSLADARIRSNYFGRDPI